MTPSLSRFFRGLAWIALAIAFAAAVIYFSIPAHAEPSDHDRVIALEHDAASNQYVAAINANLDHRLRPLETALIILQWATGIGTALTIGLVGDVVRQRFKK